MWDEAQVDHTNTFETFMAVDCNIAALRAAKAIAEKPGKNLFNPFVIYGKSGSGKTHLAQAIGNEVRRTHSHLKVLHVRVEKFIHQFVAHDLRNATYDFFHFYQSIDMLILDDLQYFNRAGKAQDAFITIFNHLHRYRKQVILTSDKLTKDIKGLHEKLLTRVHWGLTVDIQVPNYDTRIKIIQQNLERENREMPIDVIGYLACNFIDNIKDLEFALQLLLIYSTFAKKDIDLDLAKWSVNDTKSTLKIILTTYDGS